MTCWRALVAMSFLNHGASVGYASTLAYTIVEPFIIDGAEFNITASIGITTYPEDGLTSSDLMRSANSALNIAKQQGRNHYHFYTAEMNKAAIARLSVERELRHALEGNEFTLAYQSVLEAKPKKWWP